MSVTVIQCYQLLLRKHKCHTFITYKLRFIIEAPYRQIKYDTMQEEKIISNKKEAEARGQCMQFWRKWKD